MTATLSGATSLELLGTVGEAMTADVLVLHADTPADVAMRRLEHSRVSGAPVVDHGRVVGVVTLRDLLVPLLAEGPVQTTGPFHRHEQHLRNVQVRDLMTAEPVTARADAALAEVVLAMDAAGSTASRWSTGPAVRSASSPATMCWGSWPGASASSTPRRRGGRC
jgi:CBS domain-containing protein